MKYRVVVEFEVETPFPLMSEPMGIVGNAIRYENEPRPRMPFSGIRSHALTKIERLPDSVALPEQSNG